MSKKGEKLRLILEDLNVGKYYENFQKEEVMYCDLEDLTEEELQELIPSNIHRRRLTKWINCQKREQMAKEIEIETKEMSKTEEKNDGGKKIQMLVKWGAEIASVYDLPLKLTNEEMIGRLLQAFLKCEVKIQDEERKLVKEMMSFNLEKWFHKSGKSLEDTVRAVIKVEGANIGGSVEDVEKLRNELEEVKEEKDLALNQNEKLKLKLEMMESEKTEIMVERAQDKDRLEKMKNVIRVYQGCC